VNYRAPSKSLVGPVDLMLLCLSRSLLVVPPESWRVPGLSGKGCKWPDMPAGLAGKV
jgi:hypothetical protein